MAGSLPALDWRMTETRVRPSMTATSSGVSSLDCCGDVAGGRHGIHALSRKPHASVPHAVCWWSPCEYLNTIGARGQSTTCCTTGEQFFISVNRTTTDCGQPRRKIDRHLFEIRSKALLGGALRLLLVTFVVYRDVPILGRIEAGQGGQRWDKQES